MTAERIGLLLALVWAARLAAATDLGTLGPTYPIAEPHLLQQIAQRLGALQRAGELVKLEQAARSRSTHIVRHPPPVEAVRTTTAARSFRVDPSVVLAENVLGPQGELLFAAGTRANPLDVVQLSRPLLFFDARDPRQVQQARVLQAGQPGRPKPVLTGGSYLDLMQAWGVPVYYDQRGLLTRRLGIAQVPALVSQEGRQLRVDELEVAP
ncbi:type-F conjugative transfer system protein TraW [Pseudorhodoferax sp. Leaf267]|uniref:type-F conjugative transfer system protein TraW n=1 Tax=Pseudorhodoferax sp. Leaf267 TaxID=1736316 RepID=UPI0006F46D51|nr:type-F conjugative transfer system protein TraW [Pseudorhodoferax sp. Leaf267]KQP23392.1 conjugal transfer protein TraW [Pseudorhodoferax sp. Leaf267]